MRSGKYIDVIYSLRVNGKITAILEAPRTCHAQRCVCDSRKEDGEHKLSGRTTCGCNRDGEEVGRVNDESRWNKYPLRRN